MDDQANPYRPPKSEVLLETRAIVPAGKGRRLGTVFVDYVCFMGLAFCVGLLLFMAFGEAGTAVIQQVPDLLFGGLLMLAYYLFFEGVWARTPGKLVFGTVVVNEAGGKPTIMQVFVRTLCRFIPFEAFSFLGKRGWHDSIPKTHVVLTRMR
jgi:uncharacterized RDD family membrane protein YckC